MGKGDKKVEKRKNIKDKGREENRGEERKREEKRGEEKEREKKIKRNM